MGLWSPDGFHGYRYDCNEVSPYGEVVRCARVRYPPVSTRVNDETTLEREERDERLGSLKPVVDIIPAQAYENPTGKVKSDTCRAEQLPEECNMSGLEYRSLGRNGPLSCAYPKVSASSFIGS